MKQRRPTTITTITTVHNQTTQGRVTVHVEIRYWLCFHHFSCAPDFFCVFHQTFDAQQAECSICSMALCAAWLWHLHRQPWVLQRGRLLSVGCSYPSGDSLHMESLSVSGDTKVGIQRGGLHWDGRRKAGGCFFRDTVRKCNDSVLVLQAGRNCVPTKWYKNDKGGYHRLNIVERQRGECCWSLLSLCKYYSGGKYTAMHWVSMSAKFMVCLITLQVIFYVFGFLVYPNI